MNMTALQRFLNDRARGVSHLYCRICQTKAPRFANGVCDDCSRGRGDDAGGAPPPRAPAPLRRQPSGG